MAYMDGSGKAVLSRSIITSPGDGVQAFISFKEKLGLDRDFLSKEQESIFINAVL